MANVNCVSENLPLVNENTYRNLFQSVVVNPEESIKTRLLLSTRHSRCFHLIDAATNSDKIRKQNESEHAEDSALNTY